MLTNFRVSRRWPSGSSVCDPKKFRYSNPISFSYCGARKQFAMVFLITTLDLVRPCSSIPLQASWLPVLLPPCSGTQWLCGMPDRCIKPVIKDVRFSLWDNLITQKPNESIHSVISDSRRNIFHRSSTNVHHSKTSSSRVGRSVQKM